MPKRCEFGWDVLPTRQGVGASIPGNRRRRERGSGGVPDESGAAVGAIEGTEPLCRTNVAVLADTFRTLPITQYRSRDLVSTEIHGRSVAGDLGVTPDS